MWNRIRECAARAYPVVLLLGIVLVDGAVSDRTSALNFMIRRNTTHLDAIHAGKRPLSISAYKLQADQLQGAVNGARRSALAVSWLLLAGSFGYLLLARETWRFRLSVFGIILVAVIAQAFFYPLY